jgi:hypothetical protein
MGDTPNDVAGRLSYLARTPYLAAYRNDLLNGVAEIVRLRERCAAMAANEITLFQAKHRLEEEIAALQAQVLQAKLPEVEAQRAAIEDARHVSESTLRARVDL